MARRTTGDDVHFFAADDFDEIRRPEFREVFATHAVFGHVWKICAERRDGLRIEINCCNALEFRSVHAERKATAT